MIQHKNYHFVQSPMFSLDDDGTLTATNITTGFIRVTPSVLEDPVCWDRVKTALFPFKIILREFGCRADMLYGAAVCEIISPGKPQEVETGILRNVKTRSTN